MISRLKYSILLLVSGLFMFFTPAFAQAQKAKKFFVYIQNEEGTPFYVKENNSTVLSSSHAGYIIIPQLTKGDYTFTIGLPGNQAAEASFKIQLNGNGDKGLLLREGNGQLALYSLKDFKELPPIAVASAPGNRIVSMPVASSNSSADNEAPRQQPDSLVADSQPEAGSVQKDTGANDAFSKMLNKIMGTTHKPAVTASVAQNPPVEGQRPPLDTLVKTVNTNIAMASPAMNDSGTAQKTIKGNGKDSSGIARDMNNLTTRNMASASLPDTFSSHNNALQFINFLADSLQEHSSPQVPVVTGNTKDHADVSRTPVPTRANNVQAEAVTPPPAAEDSASQIAMGNSDCRQLASEDFFQKMRRKMASRSDDESMFRIAQKYFSGGTCFSTQQIQSLTFLFMTDEYKYKFLELAYPHAYDSNHFPSLIKTLGSDYYRGRFKAMVR